MIELAAATDERGRSAPKFLAGLVSGFCSSSRRAAGEERSTTIE